MILLNDKAVGLPHFRLLENGEKTDKYCEYYHYVLGEWKKCRLVTEITSVSNVKYRRPVSKWGWVKTFCRLIFTNK